MGAGRERGVCGWNGQRLRAASLSFLLSLVHCLLPADALTVRPPKAAASRSPLKKHWLPGELLLSSRQKSRGRMGSSGKREKDYMLGGGVEWAGGTCIAL